MESRGQCPNCWREPRCALFDMCPREAGAHPYLPSGRRHDLCIAGFQFDDVVKEPVVPTHSGRRRRPGNVGLERFLDEFL
jgi:hypothetical protein